MPLDPRIPLMGNVYQPDFGQIAQTRAQGMNVLSQMRQRDQELAQQNQLAAYMKNNGLTRDPLGALQFGKPGQEALTAFTAQQQAQTAQDKAAREAEQKLNEQRAEGRARSAAFLLNSAGTPDDVQYANVIAKQYGIDDDEIAQTNSWLASQPDIKQAVRGIAMTDENTRKAVEAVSPKLEKIDAGDKILFVDASPGSPTFKQTLGEVPKGASPDAEMTAQTAALNRANQLAIAQVQQEGANARAQQKAAADKDEKVERARNTAITYSTMALDSVDQALKLIGKGEAGFLGATMSNLAGSNAFTLENSAYATIRSALSLERLAEIRQASPSGAALGNVSNYENKLLGEGVAALNTGLPEDVQKRNLRKIGSALRNIISINSDQPPIPRVTTDAEADKLKSGDLFYDEDFNLRRLP